MKQRLGKGLSALIPTRDGRPAEKSVVSFVSIGSVQPNPRQPRTSFHQERLEELTESIREHGILQPLIVTRKGSGYELIAGERRYHAAKKVGLKTLPVIVRDATEQQKLELGLVENLQRHDLNPMEEATAFQKLMDEFNLTQESVGKRVGKSRSYVANALRLLGLPEKVKRAILQGKITEGHAKVILGLPTPDEQIALMERMVTQSLSVRAGEDAVRAVRKRPVARRQTGAYPDAAARLQRTLGTKVRIEPRGAGGVIHIEFYSKEELEQLLNALNIDE